MKAILMAAGVGSRISRAVNKPKSTLDVGGTPLIVKTVDMLLKRGIEVAVVVGFKHDEVERVLSDRDVKFYHNPFYRVTNSLASLWFAREFMCDDDLILANADVFWGEDLLDIILEDGHPFMMLGDMSRAKDGDYFFKVEDGYIRKYGKELDPEDRNSEYVGIARIDRVKVEGFRRDLEAMVESEKYDLWWENVLYEGILDDPVYVEDVSQFFWAEIDYIDDYMRISEFIETGDLSCKYRLM